MNEILGVLIEGKFHRLYTYRTYMYVELGFACPVL